MTNRACGHTDPRSCDIDCRVGELERIVHPEGRCRVCDGGKPYWPHNVEGGHPFTPARAFTPAQRADTAALVKAARAVVEAWGGDYTDEWQPEPFSDALATLRAIVNPEDTA